MSPASQLSRGLFAALIAVSVGCASLRSRPEDRRPYSATGATPPAAAAAPNRPASTKPAPTTKLYPVREEQDVVYSRAGGEDLLLDLFVPRDVAGSRPAVVFIHGGGWAKGSRVELRPASHALAEHGYVVATVEYRLAPRHKFPAPLYDVKAAVRWLRANAERCQLDSERIAVLGFSAGAHLALLTGLTEPSDGLEGDGGNPEQSSKVQAVINMMGPTDLSRPDWPTVSDAMIADMIGGSRSQMANVYWAASPLAYVRRGVPPVLTIHGTKDQLVPYEQATMLHASLRKVKGVSRLETMHGRDHGENWKPDDLKHSVNLILDFLDKNLRPR